MFDVKLKWLGCACFEMDFGGVHIVADPQISNNEKTGLTWENVEKYDYITLSHGHHDHIMDIPALVEKFAPCILCGEGTAMPLMQWANSNPMEMYPMTPNLELNFGKVKVQALFGRHTPLAGTFRERNDFWKGHRLCGKDELLYQLALWGDLEYRNFLFTTPEEMAALCKEMGCKVVIPHHIDFPKDYTQLVENLGESLAKITPEIQYIVPQYNQWISL